MGSISNDVLITLVRLNKYFQIYGLSSFLLTTSVQQDKWFRYNAMFPMVAWMALNRVLQKFYLVLYIKFFVNLILDALYIFGDKNRHLSKYQESYTLNQKQQNKLKT
jgi:hypothetical protein